ncbi:hypothetical protein MSPP1_003866 [Malassezia sp. CBS 17886]|nr:hypothetical protein MSPP1_003866 [Malassezia sp. CBS 17886]
MFATPQSRKRRHHGDGGGSGGAGGAGDDEAWSGKVWSDDGSSDGDEHGGATDRTRAESPAYVTGEHAATKRRHLYHEIGGALSNMRLAEGGKSTGPTFDTDMGRGNSYEIEPNRVYVHSLDSSDDDEGAYAGPSEWAVNRYAAQQSQAARTAAKPDFPSWLPRAPEDDGGNAQALVLWQPPTWPTGTQDAAAPGAHAARTREAAADEPEPMEE